MQAGGSMLSFAVMHGVHGARQFVHALQWIPLASSLGSVYTTLEIPEELDFADEALGDRADAYAIPPGLIRFSVGTEAPADILRDVSAGLDAAWRAAAV
jgi:cystathionine beta-lyase/cystathionine gamma-synthase